GFLREDIENHGNDLNLAYTFNNRVPSQITQTLRVFKQMDRVRYTALYAQDQWRVTPRMTLNYGLRWEFSGAATNPNEVYSGPTVEH
ncbi:hypothetical protein WFJ45_22775, partial [Salmonella enterica subsp. enterica serovar Minnesota]|uniref:hypothetical protein n=1 Tax=Salmonella enterica TaxID=28901 RepID=UPI003D29B619